MTDIFNEIRLALSSLETETYSKKERQQIIENIQKAFDNLTKLNDKEMETANALGKKFSSLKSPVSKEWKDTDLTLDKTLQALNKQKTSRAEQITPYVQNLWGLKQCLRTSVYPEEFDSLKTQQEKSRIALAEAYLIFELHTPIQIKSNFFLTALYDEFIICHRYPKKDTDFGGTGYPRPINATDEFLPKDMSYYGIY